MFYGWKLATIGSCGNLLLQGSVFYTMNAFIEPLVELHGWPGRDRSEHDFRIGHDDVEYADRDYAHKQDKHPASDDARGFHRRAELCRARLR